MKNFHLNNWHLKLLALFLAIITWFYIVVELQKGAVEEGEILQRILPYKISSKELHIKLNLVGEPLDGYIVDYDNISMEPSKFIIVGPKSILKKLSSVLTQPIDITKSRRSFTKDVSIVPPTKAVSIKDKFVTIMIPILKAED